MAAKGNKIELSTFQKYDKLEIADYKSVDKNEKRLLILFGVSSPQTETSTTPAAVAENSLDFHHPQAMC